MSRLSRICQGRQTSRDVTVDVCIVDTGTLNNLLFQLCTRLCLHVFSTLEAAKQSAKHSQCLGTSVPHSLVDNLDICWREISLY